MSKRKALSKSLRSLTKNVRWLLLLAVPYFPLQAQESHQIQQVKVEGNRRVETSAILLQVKKKSGIMTNEEISQVVKVLYKTGFFDQVTAAIEYEGGREILVFTVVEKPVVKKVFIKGNKEVTEADLANAFTFGDKRFLDKSKLDTLARAGVSLYQSRGFYDAQITSSVVPANDNQVDVTFTINEGRRYKISRIRMRGIKTIDEGDLLSAIETKRYKWWSSWLLGTGRLSQEMLENDRNLVRQYFLDHGYLDATVSDPQIKKGKGTLEITFDINEGTQYKIGSIAATGDLIDGSEQKTLEQTSSKQGEVFNASKIRADSFVISEKFGDIGYAFANVIPNTELLKESGKVNLHYTIEKGKKVRIGKVVIRGNQKTYDNVIRRDVLLGEKETFSTSKIKRSETLLKRLGYFEEVNVSSEPSQKDDEVNLAVNVKEAQTGTFTAGAGYSTSDGVILNGRISENNLFGTGRRMDLNLDWGSQRNNLQLSFEDPRLNDTQLSVEGDVLRSERQFRDFDRRFTGGGTTLGYPVESLFGPIAQDVRASLRYEFIKVDIFEIDPNAAELVKTSDPSTTSSSFTPQLVRNTIDNPLNPSKGSRQILSVELAGLGGDQRFYLAEARNQWFYPLFDLGFGDFTFSWRTAVGYGDTFNDEAFPLFRRFFPGGRASVRGYDERSLGPRDPNGREFGGSKQFVNNLELIFPLVNSAGLKGVVFYDMGQAFDDNDTIKFGDLRKGYGFGVRWASPMGPIRIEVGFPVSPLPGEDSHVIHFSFGAPL